MLRVTDSLSNAHDQIARAAKILGRSKQKTAVFRAICHGKKRAKTVEDVVKNTGMTRKRVLEEAAKLANQHLIVKRRENGGIVYERDPFLAENRQQILSLAGDLKRLDRFPTKTNPSTNGRTTVTVRLPRRRVRVKSVVIDDIDSFSAVVGVAASQVKLTGISEKAFKEGLKRILGEHGDFTDWGGEKNDLLSTRLVYKKKRRRAAFALKGPGTGGRLTPAKLGKNGDQIQRLFQTSADFYFVQYWNQIDESVPEQMGQFAVAKSFAEGREVYYGIIDGADSARLVQAYPRKFNPSSTRKGAKRASKTHQARWR